MNSQIQIDTIFDKDGMDVYSSLGKIKLLSMSELNKHIFNDMDSEEKKLNKIKNIFTDIFSKRKPTISLIELKKIVFDLTNTSVKKLNNTINKLIKDITNEISMKIQEDINKDIFTIDNFISIFCDYYTRCCIISEYLEYYTNKIICDNNKSFFQIIYEYVFYSNVINKKYIYNNEYIYLYDLINELIKKNMITIIPKELYAIHEIYRDMSESLGSRDIEMFNVDIDKRFLINIGDDINYVQKYVIEINKYVIKCYKLKYVKNMDNLNETKSDLKNFIKIMSSFCNKNIFYKYYISLLKNRIMMMCADISIENYMYKLLKNNSDNDNKKWLREIKMLIRDLEESNEFNNYFSNIYIKNNSDTYENSIINLINNLREKERIKFINTQENLWNNDLEDENIYEKNYINNVPSINIISDMYNIFNEIRYLGKRKYNHDYRNSFVLIDYNVGDNKYKIKMSLLQYSVLEQFKNNNKWNVEELSKNLGLKINKLGDILNDFLKSNILERDEGEINNTKLNFYLKEDFYSEYSNISITNDNNKEIETDKKNEIDKVTVLEKILEFIKDNDNNENNIIDYIKKLYGDNINKDSILEYLNFGIDNDFMEKKEENGEFYYIIKPDDLDLESDSELSDY